MTNPYQQLPKTPANYAALTPLSFFERAAAVYPERLAVIHGDLRRTWGETYSRCRRLASALQQRGIDFGDTVAAMLPNIPAMLEAHFAIPMAGAVLNALNTRLDADAIAFMLRHGNAKLVLVDKECAAVMQQALQKLDQPPIVIDVDDILCATGERIGTLEYEELLAAGDPDFNWDWPDDEWNAITLNYTSGTTGNPKGVVCHHRGAFLNAIANTLVWPMGQHPVYLWTLPMFHCNGWCFPWTLAALAGTSVCLRQVREDAIFNAIRDHQVTHLCGAPIILNMLINAPAKLKTGIEHQVQIMTAASAPPAAVLEAMENMGFKVTHVYGLTEVYGPAVVCAWHEEWDGLDSGEQARLKARQGVRYPMLEQLQVADPETLQPTSRDGETLGEIFMRGNIVMKGYLNNPQATEKAFSGGWFHTGDMAVCHPDGYVEIKDRAKDIIISGGENISTIEIEGVLYRHPAVLEAAVVAKPDPHWGETPCAFVTLKIGQTCSEQELIEFCKQRMARFKAPKNVVFGELPKTSTGKIQKFALRERAKEF